MIFEVFNAVNDLPETQLFSDEVQLRNFLEEQLLIFPINRIKLRKNYSENSFEVSLEIELDSTLTSEKIYKKIASRLFNTLGVKLITIENTDSFSNFNYFFYGESTILNYNCSIFVDIPIKAYIPQKKVKFN